MEEGRHGEHLQQLVVTHRPGDPRIVGGRIAKHAEQPPAEAGEAVLLVTVGLDRKRVDRHTRPRTLAGNKGGIDQGGTVTADTSQSAEPIGEALGRLE